ncbi:hypothetical protein ID866_7337 [Astraeus odoratus]|nr:hypothetical protein ID866_7337 [Astraeus odoratus]
MEIERFYEACQRQANIDTELIFQENDKVVLHNNCGTEIAPLIIVFTKLDLLIQKIEKDFGENEELESSVLEERIRDELEVTCIQPLRSIAGADIPNVAVSVEEGYECTVDQLLEVTAGKVEKHVGNEAAIAAVMAQRACISQKLSNLISVGKKRYWRGLASNSKFLGYTLKECLDVIHADIVACWNFEDPCRYLVSEQFKTLMLNMVTNLDTRDLPESDVANIGFGLSVASAIAGIRGTAVRVVLPIAASAMLLGWVYDSYQYSYSSLAQSIAYIVDLNAVMQILFLLIPQGHITIPAIKLAITAFNMAGINEVHSQIRDYYGNPDDVLILGGRDQALDMIIQLIKETSIKSEELGQLRAKIGDLTKLQRDDPRYGWDDDE